MGSQAGHLARPLQKFGIRRRANWLWENPALPWAFQTAVRPVIIRTSPFKLGKSLVFHEIVMFLMPTDRFTSKPKNRDRFLHPPPPHPSHQSWGREEKWSPYCYNEWKRGKTRVPGERGNAEFRSGSFDAQRTSCVLNVLFSRGVRIAALLIFLRTRVARLCESVSAAPDSGKGSQRRLPA